MLIIKVNIQISPATLCDLYARNDNYWIQKVACPLFSPFFHHVHYSIQKAVYPHFLKNAKIEIYSIQWRKHA